MKKKDLLSIGDLSSIDIHYLMEKAISLKNKNARQLLKNRVLSLLFEKPSLRTKVSFSVAMYQLGGNCIFLPRDEIGIGSREDISDIAQVLSRYVDGIVYRTFSHQFLEQLARFSSIPVINGLSDLEHPCQALSDLLTIYEKKGPLKGLNLAYIGDGNNVANSLALASLNVGMNFIIASPPGYDMNKDILDKARESGRKNNAAISLDRDPFRAVKKADIIYTDVWTSMGQEKESEKRRQDFSGFRVNSRMLSSAPGTALLMHPLPAHYGEEVDKDILQGPRSIVYDQAENRLHMQKAILVYLLNTSSSI